MTDDARDANGESRNRAENGLLLGTGFALLGYGVAHWSDVVAYRPPVVLSFAAGVVLFAWGASRMWRDAT